MAAACPAVEKTMACADRASAESRCLRIRPRLQKRERNHRLHRGTGRVEALERFVTQWDMIVLCQHIPFQMADAVGKAVGIEAGHWGQGQHIAGQAIHHEHRARLIAQPPRSTEERHVGNKGVSLCSTWWTPYH